MKILIAVLMSVLLFFPTSINAWEGYDKDTGEEEREENQLGAESVFYDPEGGTYEYGTVNEEDDDGSQKDVIGDETDDGGQLDEE